MNDENKSIYLIVNGKVVSETDNSENWRDKFLPIIFKLNLHTRFYGTKIDSLEHFNNFFDWHSGAYQSCDDLLDKNNEYVDLIIVEQFYLYDYPEAKQAVEDHLEVSDKEEIK